MDMNGRMDRPVTRRDRRVGRARKRSAERALASLIRRKLAALSVKSLAAVGARATAWRYAITRNRPRTAVTFKRLSEERD